MSSVRHHQKTPASPNAANESGACRAMCRPKFHPRHPGDSGDSWGFTRKKIYTNCLEFAAPIPWPCFFLSFLSLSCPGIGLEGILTPSKKKTWILHKPAWRSLNRKVPGPRTQRPEQKVEMPTFFLKSPQLINFNRINFIQCLWQSYFVLGSTEALGRYTGGWGVVRPSRSLQWVREGIHSEIMIIMTVSSEWTMPRAWCLLVSPSHPLDEVRVFPFSGWGNWVSEILIFPKLEQASYRARIWTQLLYLTPSSVFLFVCLFFH